MNLVVYLYVYSTVALAVLTLLGLVENDLYTAVDGLEKVLHAEVGVADELNNYIKHQEKQLDALRAVSEDYRRHGLQSLKDIKASLGNPVNAFLLMKRFTSDWEKVKKMLPNTTDNYYVQQINGKARNFPTDSDFVGAAKALLRIQDTYQLTTAQMAKGEIEGVKWPVNMTAEDCFEVGFVAYKQIDYYHAILWFQESLAILEKEDVKSVEKFYVLDHLAFTLYKKGNLKEALRLTEELLKLDPSNTRLEEDVQYYTNALRDPFDTNEETTEVEYENTRIYRGYHKTEEFGTYEKLCRGERTNKHYPWHKLTCQFKRHHPFFYIRPLREETAYTDPLIVVYHDIMTDVEINTIKQYAQPKLVRSAVESDGVIEEYRISQTAWLTDDEHWRIAAVSKKVQVMTNMSMETAEQLQVLNYGIGGHYEPHNDFFSEEKENTEADGNRIMTVIYYMTDVEAGGATVFPNLGVTLWPKKGSCAVWYNLKANGDGDYRTRHAGCPVLVGSKWVCNKWIHERGQEFARPCTLNPEE